MPDFETFSAPMTNSLADTPIERAPMVVAPKYNDAYLLDMFDKLKRESFEHRWVWEREWLRDIYYTVGRQWIYWNPSSRGWTDKRLQKWIPRPVTNKCAEIVQAIRANFATITLGVNARPVGHDPESIAAADIADKMAPLIHEEHIMNMVLRENDFWMIVTGNAAIQISWDKDKRFNRIFVPFEQCQQCSQVLPPDAIVQAGQACPTCGSQQFTKAVQPDGSPAGEWLSHGRGKTTSLSPFEYAVPPNVTRFGEIPYIIRLRWRDKHYYEANHPNIVGRISWEKSPIDRSLQIYKGLALTNDVSTGSALSSLGSGGSDTIEGVTEYECWIKPTTEFPEGFVMRVVGDRGPAILYAEEEGIPGPFPFKDIEGKPIFPFAHAQFEHLGGRLYGRSALAPLIQKQDSINQLDSLIQLHIQRMSNPVWIIPEGAGIDQFSGEPGWIMKWNPLAGGGAKPERISGESLSPSYFQLRAQHLKDMEELSGAFDIIKGQRPPGVGAFSTLQLLVERSQARFTSAFAARGELYRTWFKIALELERQFGPANRTRAVVGPNKAYTFEHFENAQLQGNFTIHVEDGTEAPKTALGKRAAIEHANQLRLLDPADPDQKYAILTQLGLSDLVPSLDIHVQAALQIQDAFERWLEAPQGPSPLQVKSWHNLQIHWGERIKWLNSDRMREVLAANPEAEPLVGAHIQMLQMMMSPPPLAGLDGKPANGPVGAGAAMERSNTLSGSTPPVPQASGQQAPELVAR